ncbi:inositol-3-phosphate synthase [Streptomyces sp. NPDC002817]|uniref:inositol-3-phosphate synthase n=1 Tax=Streptomyces sp. NPDC088357 TaxID=3154655 RepID=UPI003427E0F8
MSASVSSPCVGVWLIGARGSAATTVVTGCAAVAAGLQPPTGLVTETPAFADSGLSALSSLVLGGHDTDDCPLPERAEALAAGGVLPPGLPSAVAAELAAADREIRPGGPVPGETRGEDELIAGFAADIQDFERRRVLTRAVVVNVASTEPVPTGGALPPSSLYAAAALRAGCPYVDFTPSAGPHHPATAASAASGVPYAGREGRTGQTLLRAVPAAAAVKNAGKENVLTDAPGMSPEGEAPIDDVPALGDRKPARHHIAGFLGTRMILQTIWQGCDSSLAAPLVLDPDRLTARAHEGGLSRPLTELGFCFKDPVGDGPGEGAVRTERRGEER